MIFMGFRAISQKQTWAEAELERNFAS